MAVREITLSHSYVRDNYKNKLPLLHGHKGEEKWQEADRETEFSLPQL